MSLVRTTILNGVSVAIKIGSAVVVNKVIAIFLGPTGLAVIGQFQNLLALISTLSSGLLMPGITKLTVENTGNFEGLKRVYKTSISISLILVGISIILIFIFKEYILKLLNLDSYFIVYILILLLPIIALNNLILAVLNGKKLFTIYIYSGILSSTVSAILIIFLSYKFLIAGVIVGVILLPIIQLIYIFIAIKKENVIKIKELKKPKIDRKYLNVMLKIGFMGLVSAMLSPSVLILIRLNIIEQIGYDDAGYWQGIWKISETYLALITTTLSLYLLPRISEIKNYRDLKDEVIKVLTLVIPLVTITAFIIYFSREFIVINLFTEKFNPMLPLFKWQLIGDVFKAISWVFGYVALGNGMAKIYIVSEVTFWTIFYLLSNLLVSKYGIIGATYAYASSYILYLVLLVLMLNYGIKRLINEVKYE